MDLFHLDQSSESSALFLLFQDYDRMFDPGRGFLLNAWLKVWLLHVLQLGLMTIIVIKKNFLSDFYSYTLFMVDI